MKGIINVKTKTNRGVASATLGLFVLTGAAFNSSNANAASGEFPAYIPFNAAENEQPEGVAVDKTGNVFVGIGGSDGPRGEIWKFTPEGAKSVLIDFGTPGVLGLAVDAVGNVYAARPAGRGVSRVDRYGQASHVPGTEQIAGINALAFDDQGNLYITQSFSFDPPLKEYPCGGFFGQGGIWRVPRGGSAELWVRDDLLTGLCGIPGLTFPVGANGIAFYHGALYVASSELGIVVRVPVLPGGAPGALEIAAVVPEPFPGPISPGADGIALDVYGNFYLPMPSHNVLVRVSSDGQSWETIATPADKLDAPTSVAFGTGKGERTSLFVVNLALFPGGAGPGLLKIDTGMPGLPLP